MFGGIGKGRATHLPDVTANLAGLGQEQQSRHPLVGAEACLARKVVQVSDEPVQEVLEPFILALVVDPDCVGRDVVDGQVQQLWGLRALGHGYVNVVSALSPQSIKILAGQSGREGALGH